jgi:hypothetical protein
MKKQKVEDTRSADDKVKGASLKEAVTNLKSFLKNAPVTIRQPSFPRFS